MKLPSYIVNKLDTSQIAEIKDQWAKRRAPDEDIDAISGWETAPKCTCMSVVDGKGAVHAVFDIRETPAHIKNMNVVFNPKYKFDFSGQKAAYLAKEFERLVHVLSSIFRHVVSLSNKWGIVKIYNNTREVGIIFSYFATELQKDSPQYEVKLYNKWVEISNLSAR